MWTRLGTHGVPEDRFFAMTGPIIDGAWQISVGADLQLPGTSGRVPLATRLINRYVARFQRAAHHDPGLAVAFLRVLNLMEPPASLLRPRYVLKILAGTAAADRAVEPQRVRQTTYEPILRLLIFFFQAIHYK